MDLVLESITWTRHQLAIRWRVGEHRFNTTLWYPTIDLLDLESRLGSGEFRRLAFHIGMFELNKGVSLGPSHLIVADDLADLLTDELYALWARVIEGVWGQWRYEHNRPNALAPKPIQPLAPATAPPVRQPAPNRTSLWFCGGGKDSLLAGRLLDACNEQYDALAYSHSIYGLASPQIDLISGLIEQTHADVTHRIYMTDSSLGVPDDVTMDDQYRYVLAAETPASLFASLPIALAAGHSSLVLAHEKSANLGNLIWSETGEDINHQWGKSLEAEQLLDDYLGKHLVEDMRYYSILQPAYDALIFAALQSVGSAVSVAHSCNIEKPWCRTCPKCAYVWISYMAWLDWDDVALAFGDYNLADMSENQGWYRMMLGLEEHTPFECIGTINDARLAFAMARQRGLKGAAVDVFSDEVPEQDWVELAHRILKPDPRVHRIPSGRAQCVLEKLDIAAQDGKRFVSDLFEKERR